MLEQDPLMRTVDEYATCYREAHSVEAFKLLDIKREIMNLKVKQYGDYKALWGIMSEAELVIIDKPLLEEYKRQYEEAKKAYFEDGEGEAMSDAREALRAAVQPVMEAAETYAKWWSTAPYPKDKAAIARAAMLAVAEAQWDARCANQFVMGGGYSGYADSEHPDADKFLTCIEYFKKFPWSGKEPLPLCDSCAAEAQLALLKEE